MRQSASAPFSTGRFWPWALLYAVLIAYSSTVIGPAGPHFVPAEPGDAWIRFLRQVSTWVDNGSDQRADWMANLGMFVPFGFLLAGSVWPSRPGMRPVAALSAFGLAVAVLLAVKFAQIVFPPRTVTLNYVVAQTAGAAIGVAAFWLSHSHLAELSWQREGGGRDSLRLLLRVYTVALFVFLLMPLDFALSADDVAILMRRLPDIVTNVPGAGRPRVVQAVLLAAGTLAMVPFGMVLVLAPRGRNRFIGQATLRGFFWMLVVLFLSVLLLSGSPSLLAVGYRTIGIAIGAWSMRWLVRQDIDRVHDWLARLVPFAFALYVALLLAVNGLVSTHWRSPAVAADTIYVLGLIPLFDYYIVTKAEAAKNIVAHAVMYAPIGLFFWVRGSSAGRALVAALLLALVVEAARYLRPGLEGDINAVAVAALSAFVAAKLMPTIWWMLEGVAIPKASILPEQVPGWRERAAVAKLREAATPTGDVEHF